MVDGVDLGMEKIGVSETSGRVGEGGAGWIEEGVVERDAGGVLRVGEVGIGVDEERSPGASVERKQGADVGEEVGAEDGVGRGIGGGSEDGEGVGGSDDDFTVEAEGGEGGMEVVHGGDEAAGERGGVGPSKDLVADSDGGDLGGWVECLDVGADPGEGLVGISSDGGETTVWKTDDELDAAVGEGMEDGRVSVIEADTADADGGEEAGNELGRGQVVGDAAVVDADEGCGCGGGGNRQDEKEERNEEWWKEIGGAQRHGHGGERRRKSRRRKPEKETARAEHSRQTGTEDDPMRCSQGAIKSGRVSE